MALSKKSIIEALLKQGVKPIEIHKKTGYSYRYICNISLDLRNPGILYRSTRKWLESGGKEKLKTWRKKRGKLACEREYQQRIRRTHWILTRQEAINHRQEWTIKDLDFLREHGGKITIHELAIALGRTYGAIQSAGSKFGISLKGEKIEKSKPYVGMFTKMKGIENTSLS